MKWILPEEIPQKLLRHYAGLNPVEAQVLFQRGFYNKKEIDKFFNLELKNVPEYSLMPNIIKAAKKILKAVESNKRIFIYGDYDVDGVAATAILFDFLFRTLKADVMPYIPDRFDEGYGLGEKGLEYIKNNGGSLVISVDCGIRDDKLIEKYVNSGIDFIITDHHELPLNKSGKTAFPKKAFCVVHPSLPGSKYPDKAIAGANVSWKLVQAVNEILPKKKKIDKNKYIDLVALATVCDIMPLVGENRIIVKYGLLKMQDDPHPGLQELLNISGIAKNDVDTYHFGYLIGPRLNAAGRVSHAMEGLRLLTSKRKNEIKESARKLHFLNIERQELTKSMLDDSWKQAEIQLKQNKKLLFVYGLGWSEGIVGLVAGKLNERYYLPALAAGINKGLARGSARSIEGFDITAAIAANESLLERFGGHKQAAGFTLKQDRLTDFISKIQDLAGRLITNNMLEKSIKIDALIDVNDLNDETVSVLNRFKPFGFGNREPVMHIKDLVLMSLKPVGRDKQHLKLLFKGSGNHYLSAVLFNYEYINTNITPGAKYDILGFVSLSEWNGIRKVEIRINDIRLSI